MCGLLVAPKIEKGVAVPDEAFPIVLEQRLDLSHVLDDDGHADLTAAHGGQQLLKIVRQRDVGKLVHHEVNVDGEPAAVFVVRR